MALHLGGGKESAIILLAGGSDLGFPFPTLGLKFFRAMNFHPCTRIFCETTNAKLGAKYDVPFIATEKFERVAPSNYMGKCDQVMSLLLSGCFL